MLPLLALSSPILRLAPISNAQFNRFSPAMMRSDDAPPPLQRGMPTGDRFMGAAVPFAPLGNANGATVPVREALHGSGYDFPSTTHQGVAGMTSRRSGPAPATKERSQRRSYAGEPEQGSGGFVPFAPPGSGGGGSTASESQFPRSVSVTGGRNRVMSSAPSARSGARSPRQAVLETRVQSPGTGPPQLRARQAETADDRSARREVHQMEEKAATAKSAFFRSASAEQKARAAADEKAAAEAQAEAMLRAAYEAEEEAKNAAEAKAAAVARAVEDSKAAEEAKARAAAAARMASEAQAAVTAMAEAEAAAQAEAAAAAKAEAEAEAAARAVAEAKAKMEAEAAKAAAVAKAVEEARAKAEAEVDAAAEATAKAAEEAMAAEAAAAKAAEEAAAAKMEKVMVKKRAAAKRAAAAAEAIKEAEEEADEIDALEAEAAAIAAAAAASTRAAEATLAGVTIEGASLVDKKNAVCGELGLSGNLPSVAAGAAEALGVDADGKSSAVVLDECYAMLFG